MRLLLDTHIFIWWNGDSDRIVAPLRQAIICPSNEIFVSAASVWEIGIKRAIGKLAFANKIVETIIAHGFQVLSITGEHVEFASDLPRYHDDPFDRLLVAQAVLERMLFGTRDPKIRPYGVPLLGPAGSR